MAGGGDRLPVTPVSAVISLMILGLVLFHIYTFGETRELHVSVFSSHFITGLSKSFLKGIAIT